jgi:cytochrome c553
MLQRWFKITSARLALTLLVLCALSAPSATTAMTASATEDGKPIYANNCLRCHGNTGLIMDDFHDKYNSEQALKAYISAEMPKNNPGSLSDSEYSALASYIVSLNPKKQPPPPPPPPPPVKKKLSIVGKRISLEGKELKMSSQPQLIGGKLMVPFRPIFEAFQLKPTWNSAKKTITGSNSQYTILLTINSNKAVVNGKSVTLDAVPRISAGSTLVPIRFVAETLGLQVEYRAK